MSKQVSLSSSNKILFHYQSIFLVVRTKTCLSKRSPLEGRHEETCPRTLAISEINKWFKQGHHYDFLITDDCGKILRNMTADLNIIVEMGKFAGDGTTPFKAKLDDINLNCDDNVVLNVYTPKPADSSDSSNSNSYYNYKDPRKSS
ncbi:hypothetical protein C2G38_2197583 [Gigaspora rosea]|uniref:Uncharacterized protein n=1 Tax=Gigaspora rosea TaxID=44941 RepID=A0A397UWI8_9GLOM|nr:hypothetical protein C2G38_2197583 [Gigaspora rosea]